MKKRTITEVLLEECPNCGAARKGDEEIVEEINLILQKTELDEDSSEITRSEVIFELEEKYSWEVLQQALFRILLDENRTEDDWYQMACVFWHAICAGDTRKKKDLPILKFNKKTIIALLYYRLWDSDDLTENLLWSITCDLYHLDYCDSMYDPVKDEKINKELAKYGLSF